jgi:hypothetical protein
MKKKDKLKMMSIVMKFFGVTHYIMTWYGEASEDEVIDTDELAQLGAGICNILGLRVNVKVPNLGDEKSWS